MNAQAHKTLSFLLFLLLLSLFSGTLSAHAAELEDYERKYVVVYPGEHAAYNQGLKQALRTKLPRFSYDDFPSLNLPLEDFAQQVYAHQQAHAGALAAEQSPPDLRIGTQVVTWSLTQKIMNSAYVLVPHWDFGELQLKYLTPGANDNWNVDLVSDLTLQLAIYKIEEGRLKPYRSLEESWEMRESIGVPGIEAIVEALQEPTAGLAHPANPLLQPLILEALKALPQYQKLLEGDPSQRFGSRAAERLQEVSYAGLIQQLKQQGDFALKSQIEEFDAHRVIVALPPGETAARLGLQLDQGYQIIEYRQSKHGEQAVPIGYARLREIQHQDQRESFVLQTILAERDFELGDQLLEYPQRGIQFDLLAGVASFGFEDQAQTLTPQGGLRLNYSLAALSGISELYASLSATTALPVSLQLSSESQTAYALPYTGEVGLLKRWYLRQWIFEAGIQGGVIGGVLFNTAEDGLPSMLSLGASAFVGTGWQITPDLMLGLQGGWRLSAAEKWRVETDFGLTPLEIPALIAQGPLLQVYGQYLF